MKRRYDKIIKRHLNKDVSQAYWLKKIIKETEKSVYCKKYNLTIKDNYINFKEKVPIVTYEDISPYIERMLGGEKNVLINEKVRWFAKSSGTTNSYSKYIPTNKKILKYCHLKGGKDMLSFYFHNYPDSKILGGKMVGITGSLQKTFAPDISVGDVSAVIVKHLPIWAEFGRVPRKKIALGNNWNEKADKIIELTKNKDVRMFSGVPTWTAIILERLKEKYGVTSPKDIWPNLEAFFHGGVAFGPYKEYFKKLMAGKELRYLEIYNASEGFFAIQDKKDREDMFLLLDNGVFYEFIKIKDFYSKNYNAIPITEICIGETYALVISTVGGLLRYLIGDKIEVTSTDPVRIKIVGRTKYFLNTFGEEIVIENIEKAIARAQEKTGLIIKYFTVAPIFMEEGKSGAHEWVLEFDEENINLDVFKKIIDEELQSINSDYKAKRTHDVILGEPKMIAVKKGTFEKWFQKKGKLGGQNKIPPLSSDRKIIEEILSLV